MKINETQLEQVNDRIQALVRSNSFYGKKLGGCRHDRSTYTRRVRQTAVL